eukprot:gnl/MRDRNA2_/MRDRNA2_85951_c0_seq2.p1 gnl/MRDRNA2_/MRDRNA2_85951_c0~~gnl/MRDRNA2_/MRDRNA2_85951_c0_seq2.p1  ORF type:complete len:929 (+),score=198.54 gnl/MRDRNA2_/MRDRNA2_85951_c0_seq2:92-2878(+)
MMTYQMQTERTSAKKVRFGTMYVGTAQEPPMCAPCEPEKKVTPDFHARPGVVLTNPSVPYVQLTTGIDGSLVVDAELLLRKTPLPKGAASFSSVHIVTDPSEWGESAGQRLSKDLSKLGRACHVYHWPQLEVNDVKGEYDAIFRIGSDILLNGADRTSLMVFMAQNGSSSEMAIAAMISMLPFRGMQAAFVTQDARYVDPLGVLRTRSGLFEYGATEPQRMGRPPLAAVFGPLCSRTFSQPLRQWEPVQMQQGPQEKPAPFKIGGLELPMVTFEGAFEAGVERLANLLIAHFGSSLFPVVAVGETGDAIGYGSDILSALAASGCPGHYFAHRSGESFKRADEFGDAAMLEAISKAKQAGLRVVIIAVGGGANGNSMGVISAMTGADFIQVPTTLMHYNDATTSAKQAFSLVVDGKILSKNILGAFYLPQLVFCISEVFLTLDKSSIHAAVGEATKTMGMLGAANSKVGQQDFHNILGASEFASDFTRIVGTVGGFMQLIEFLKNTITLKQQIVAVGDELRKLHQSSNISEVEVQALRNKRKDLLGKLRVAFKALPSKRRQDIMAFLTTINEEIIKAKAMFLAYSDPFEKYRALLFEYAHTLGHGLEAFMAGLYRKAEAAGIPFPEALRLHGQCVGMAVIWAGEMSKNLGHLDGDGYLAHQSLVYLFNRFGGFNFGPLRELCDKLGVSKEEFCEGVLQVVRRDNKRGYCACGKDMSVDQLVQNRPGCLLRSKDPSAELRYLVEVSEDSQRVVLSKAFDGEYDRMLVPLNNNEGGVDLHFMSFEKLQEPLTENGPSLTMAVQAAQSLSQLLKQLQGEGDESFELASADMYDVVDWMPTSKSRSFETFSMLMIFALMIMVSLSAVYVPTDMVKTQGSVTFRSILLFLLCAILIQRFCPASWCAPLPKYYRKTQALLGWCKSPSEEIEKSSA